MIDLLHTPGAVYPAGTRYSNSITYDEATDELIHGWQVFIQKAPDGTPTGDRSFLNNQGRLCGESIAKQERERATREAAPELLAAAQAAVESVKAGPPECIGYGEQTQAAFAHGWRAAMDHVYAELAAAREAIAKAAGAAS